jgi:hypothetical protein
MIFEFQLNCMKIWVVREKIGYGEKTKYPRISSDQKTHFLKNKNIYIKLLHLEFWLFWVKIVVPRVKIVFQL